MVSVIILVPYRKVDFPLIVYLTRKKEDETKEIIWWLKDLSIVIVVFKE